MQIVRDQFAATNDRDFRRAMAMYAEDVVLVVGHGEGLANPGTYEGRDAVGAWFGDWFQTFEPGYRFEIGDARDLGDLVFVLASHSGRGRASGAEVHGETAYLYRLRDGKIAHVELFSDRAAALEAAGLPE